MPTLEALEPPLPARLQKQALQLPRHLVRQHGIVGPMTLKEFESGVPARLLFPDGSVHEGAGENRQPGGRQITVQDDIRGKHRALTEPAEDEALRRPPKPREHLKHIFPRALQARRGQCIERHARHNTCRRALELGDADREPSATLEMTAQRHRQMSIRKNPIRILRTAKSLSERNKITGIGAIAVKENNRWSIGGTFNLERLKRANPASTGLHV